MKIINLQEDIIKIIYQNDWESIHLDSNPLYLMIPNELIKEDLKISDSNWVEKDTNWRYLYARGPYTEIYLKRITGLTIQEFYDLTILHINDTNDRPKCKHCGEITTFISIFDGYRDFCDIYCKNRYLSNLPEMREIHSKRFREMNLKNNSDYEFQAYSHFCYFINNFDLNLDSILYLAGIGNSIKFGVTTTNLEIKRCQMTADSIESLAEGRLLRISWIEYQLAHYYQCEWVTESDLPTLNKLVDCLLNYDLDVLSSTTISEESKVKLLETVDPKIILGEDIV